MRWGSAVVYATLALGACAVSRGQTPSASRYTGDELVVLNGIGGFGDVGRLDTDRAILAPGNRSGFSLRIEYERRSADVPFWSLRIPLPAGDMAAYDGFSCDIRVAPGADAAMAIYLCEPDDNRWLVTDGPISRHGSGEWRRLTIRRSAMRVWRLSSKPEDWPAVRSVGVEPAGKRATFWLDNMALLAPEGSGRPDLSILDAVDDGFVAFAGRRALEPLPAAGAVLLPHDGGRMGDPAYRRSASDLNALIGRVAVPLSGFGSSTLDVRADLRARGIGSPYYGTFGGGYTRFFTRRSAWDTNANGRSMNVTPGSLSGWDFQHTYAFAHPAVTEAQRRRIDALISAGITTWMVVDYTFPWMETWWGYSDAMRRAYRADLTGADDGLHVRDGRVTRVMRFSEYFRAQHGFAPMPADAGLRDWGAFDPPRPDAAGPRAAALKTLFLMLRSYEWLKLPDRVGRYYVSRGGNRLWMIPNPEDTYGSSDYGTMVRTAGVGNLFPEWFGCIGLLAEGAYRSLPYLRELADRGGCRLSIIHEIGAGGHSSPYLAWQHCFAGIFAIAASGRADDLDNDFMDEAPLSAMRDAKSNPGQYVRLQDTLAKALAFRLARSERPVRPRPRILCVAERPPARASGSLFMGLDQPYSPAFALSRMHVPFDLRDAAGMGAALGSHDIVVYAPTNPRSGDIGLLRRWLDARPGRTLITHTFVPTRDAREWWGLDRSAALGHAGGAGVLGLGRIAALPDRPGRTTLSGAPTRALLTDEVGPLVSEARTPRGGRVVYLHTALESGVAPDARAATIRMLRAALGAVGAPRPEVVADGDTAVQTFGVRGALVVIAWDGPTLARWSFRYEPGIAALAYAAPGVSRSVTLPGMAGAGWRAWDALHDREEALSGPLCLRDVSVGMWLVGRDGPAFRAAVARFCAMRRRMPPDP